MSTRDDKDDKDREPLSLAPLAPGEAWVEKLPALGLRAARRREEKGDATLGAGLGAAARWFLPLAAAATVACWAIAAQLAPAGEPAARSVAMLGASTGSDAELIELLLSTGGRHE
jgi:hypothetical protein